MIFIIMGKVQRLLLTKIGEKFDININTEQILVIGKVAFRH